MWHPRPVAEPDEPSWQPEPGWEVDVDWRRAEELMTEGMIRLKARDRALAHELALYLDAEKAAGRRPTLSAERSPEGLVRLSLRGVELWRGPYAEIRKPLDA